MRLYYTLRAKYFLVDYLDGDLNICGISLNDIVFLCKQHYTDETIFTIVS